MRKVARADVDLPKAFIGPNSPAAKEFQQAKVRADERAEAFRTTGKHGKAYEYSAYKHDSIRSALHKLFHGKCAYCESDYHSQAPVDIEHYRPKAEITEDKTHPGYWWLAADWENLLPSCLDCNRKREQVIDQARAGAAAAVMTPAQDMPVANHVLRTSGKANSFPVDGPTRVKEPAETLANERPLLLDPCRDDPALFLRFTVDAPTPYGLVVPRGVIAADGTMDFVAQRAASSIGIYGLNRLGLLQARTRVIQHLTLLRLIIAKLDIVAKDLATLDDPRARKAVKAIEGLIDQTVLHIRSMAAPDQPYSAMVRQWIKHWLATLAPP